MLNLGENTVLVEDVVDLFELHNIELLEDLEGVVASILLSLSKTNSAEGA